MYCNKSSANQITHNHIPEQLFWRKNQIFGIPIMVIDIETFWPEKAPHGIYKIFITRLDCTSSLIRFYAVNIATIFTLDLGKMAQQTL